MDKIEQLIKEIKAALEDGRITLREALRIARRLFELVNLILPLIVGQSIQLEKELEKASNAAAPSEKG